jgi:hypothetical protein
MRQRRFVPIDGLSRQTGYGPQLVIGNVICQPSNGDLSQLTVPKIEIVVCEPHLRRRRGNPDEVVEPCGPDSHHSLIGARPEDL